MKSKLTFTQIAAVMKNTTDPHTLSPAFLSSCLPKCSSWVQTRTRCFLWSSRTSADTGDIWLFTLQHYGDASASTLGYACGQNDWLEPARVPSTSRFSPKPS